MNQTILIDGKVELNRKTNRFFLLVTTRHKELSRTLKLDKLTTKNRKEFDTEHEAKIHLSDMLVELKKKHACPPLT